MRREATGKAIRLNGNMTEKIANLGVDNTKCLVFLITSIPAKPLAQVTLKCGGFFIAPMRVGG